MKKLTVLLATLCVFFSADAQQILSGIYSGSVYNDSTKILTKYELALSEYRGKVMGYSYNTFIVNDTFYYGIRRVKGYKTEKGELVLTDEELLANNFPESPAKRVRRTATFPLAQEDTITSLKGTWETNRTKRYFSVGGTTKTERLVDSAQSPLIAHLKELNIISTPAYQDEPVAKKEPRKEEKQPKGSDIVKASDKKTTAKEPAASVGNEGATAAANNKRENKNSQPKSDVIGATSNTASRKEKEGSKTAPTSVATQKSDAATGAPVTAASTPQPAAATAPDTRVSSVMKTLEIVNDSITLSFYDNGVVDGDVISVFVNGENVIAGAKLNEVAIKKTIHLTNFAADSVQVVLVAETLGSIPPNTGLLIIRDGDTRYDVRFSADLKTNASIIFRKRKK